MDNLVRLIFDSSSSKLKMLLSIEITTHHYTWTYRRLHRQLFLASWRRFWEMRPWTSLATTLTLASLESLWCGCWDSSFHFSKFSRDFPVLSFYRVKQRDVFWIFWLSRLTNILLVHVERRWRFFFLSLSFVLLPFVLVLLLLIAREMALDYR